MSCEAIGRHDPVYVNCARQYAESKETRKSYSIWQVIQECILWRIFLFMVRYKLLPLYVQLMLCRETVAQLKTALHPVANAKLYLMLEWHYFHANFEPESNYQIFWKTFIPFRKWLIKCSKMTVLQFKWISQEVITLQVNVYINNR